MLDSSANSASCEEEAKSPLDAQRQVEVESHSGSEASKDQFVVVPLWASLAEGNGECCR